RSKRQRTAGHEDDGDPSVPGRAVVSHTVGSDRVHLRLLDPQATMTGFSRRPLDVDIAGRLLISCVDRDARDLPTYGEMATACGGSAGAVGPVLNSIARDCEAAQEPDLDRVGD